jgi:hypothetical protein
MGQCAVGCSAGLTLCGDGAVEPNCSATCADLSSNPEHCGACNAPCAAPATCVAGVCTGQGVTEDDLTSCISISDCIVVAYAHCCGATKRAINGAYLSAYESHPEWQVFDDLSICAVIGVCRDDSAVTSATCAEGICSLVFP